MQVTRREVVGLGAALSIMPRAADARGTSSLSVALSSIAARTVAQGKTAGFALGLQESRTPHIATFGAANLETGTKVSRESVFRIASCTKQFTAAAVVLLSERGKLSLDEPISKLFPEFPASGAGRVPTVHQLLTHTAGVHDYVQGGLPPEAGAGWPYTADRWRLIARMKPLYDFEPGAFWSYSNSNYVLLGALIEKVSGQPYEDFLAEHVLKPAGLRFTALDHYADVVPHRASGYSLAGGVPHAFRNADNSGLPVAEGGLRSTAGDMLRWNSALFGGRIVSPAGLRRMTEAARTVDGRPVGSAHFTPKGVNPNTPPAFVQQADYGYGLEVSRIFDTRVICHSGGISGFNSIVFHFPERRTDVVLLTNTDNGAVPAFELVLRAVTRAA